MTPLKIALRIITQILVTISVTLIIRHMLPKWKKRETEGESKAQKERIVKFDRRLGRIFLSLVIFLDLIGIFIIAFPKVITDFLEFNYVATIIIWWIPISFDNIALHFIMTEAKYDDTKIVIKKAFLKEKTYLICDILDFSKKGNLKVKTKTGNFVLYNAFYGTASLRSFLIEKSMNPFETNIFNDESGNI